MINIFPPKVNVLCYFNEIFKLQFEYFVSIFLLDKDLKYTQLKILIHHVGLLLNYGNNYVLHNTFCIGISKICFDNKLHTTNFRNFLVIETKRVNVY